MSINDITVVITTFRSEDKIKNCLNSIDRQCKVLIIENSDNSGFKKKIEEEFTNVNCILAGQNFGYAKANNLGLKKVKTKYALILNPDASLEESTLNNFLKTSEMIPDFAIMGPYVQEDKDKNNLENFEPKIVSNVKGFAMFLNLKEFREIGFFDENFFIYFEEIDLCKRLTNLNKKIYLVPSIKINHSGGQSHNESVNRAMELSRNWHWMWSTFYYHKKYKGYLPSLLIILPKLVSAFLKIFLYILIRNHEKKEIYYHRFSGIINSIIGKSSWYRPKT